SGPADHCGDGAARRPCRGHRTMSPTPRAVAVAAVLALPLMVLPWAVVALGALALVVAFAVDVVDARRPVAVERRVPGRLARGVPARMSVTVGGAGARRLDVRQPRPPD